jgi:hypothetical protein
VKNPARVETHPASGDWTIEDRMAEADQMAQDFALKNARSGAGLKRTYVGTVSTKDGTIALTSSGARPLEPPGAEGPNCGWCAEGNGVGALGGSADTVRFTKAYEVLRGDNGELAVRVKRVCTRCQDDYPDRGIFARDAKGERGGSWGDK